jgi:hypothetical protein
LRLDGHLDLDGSACYDASAANAPAIFGPGDFHADARRRVQALECLRRMGEPPSPAFAYLLQPSDDAARLLRDDIASRFARWVRQFQGYRTGENDYAKNVIGFSRRLRGLLLSYELLRRDGALSDSDVRRFNACFVFAARRILDEGRWPHSRSWKHPDHPESPATSTPTVASTSPTGSSGRTAFQTSKATPWPPSPTSPRFSRPTPTPPLAALRARGHRPPARRLLREQRRMEESINYTLYTLSYLVITFRALKGRTGRDFFHDPRMRRLIGWLCRFFGPFDKRFGVATWPAIGNAVLPQIQAEPSSPSPANSPETTRSAATASRSGNASPDMSARRSMRRSCSPPWRRTCRRAASPGPPRQRGDGRSGRLDARWLRNPAGKLLFQKIGFAKDHYEDDESAFNWYAKGTPFCMDYGTYTGDVAVGAAHNLVEIAEGDPLRRGYLADHFFSPHVDYTRCEIPVTLKLLWGRIRPFEKSTPPTSPPPANARLFLHRRPQPRGSRSAGKCACSSS